MGRGSGTYDTDDDITNVLKEPALGDLPETAQKVRRNLLVASLIATLIVIWDVKPDPNGDVFGLRFVGLTDEHLHNGLLIVVIYQFVHFLWYAVEALMEWRVRITGTKQIFRGPGGSQDTQADYAGDPRQTSLYRWWVENIDGWSTSAHTIDSVQRALREVQSQLASAAKPEGLAPSITKLTEAVNHLPGTVIRIGQMPKSARVTESLRRFDSWFELWLRSQNLRWLVIELGSPIIFGATAIFLLVQG